MRQATIKQILKSDLQMIKKADLLLPAITDELERLKIEYEIKTGKFDQPTIVVKNQNVCKITLFVSRIDIFFVDSALDPKEIYIFNRFWRRLLKNSFV